MATTRKSTGEYPEGWPEFAQQIKEEAGWKCVRCQHLHEPETGYTLTVHHLTMNKAEPFANWWAFVPLCQRCHLQIQAKVILDRPWFLPHSEWFRPYVAGYYAAQHDLPTDKSFVLARIDQLIALGQSAVLNEPVDMGELAAAWPPMPDIDGGTDLFAQYPVAGNAT